MFCKCNGSHKVKQIGTWDGCPLQGNSHTSFIVLKCSDCGGIKGFPGFNFNLALREGTPETKKKLNEIISDND